MSIHAVLVCDQHTYMYLKFVFFSVSYNHGVVPTTPASVCMSSQGVVFSHCHVHATSEPQCVMDASIVHVLDSDSCSSDFGTQKQRPRLVGWGPTIASTDSWVSRVYPYLFHCTARFLQCN